MSETKESLKFFVGEYSGRTMVKKGTKDDKEWKFFTLEVKDPARPDAKYPVKFGCFNTCKGFELLEEGAMLTFGYVENTYVNKFNKEVTSKNVRYIGIPKEEPNKVMPEALKPVLEAYVKNGLKPTDVLVFAGEDKTFGEVLKGWI